MLVAYILIVLCVAVWALVVPAKISFSDGVQRAITVFGGAFLLAVCCLDLLPEVAQASTACHQDERPWLATMPFVAILVGFLVQQLIDGLSAYAEHGHTEGGFTLGGMLVGLSLHAFLEGMPLVSQQGAVNWGLTWGIVIHNIPVALILVALMAERGYGFGRMLLVLVGFGLMSPLGSLTKCHLLNPDPNWQAIICGLVVGVLLHVSSSILFDHKRHHFSGLNIGLIAAAFVVAGLIIL